MTFASRWVLEKQEEKRKSDLTRSYFSLQDHLHASSFYACLVEVVTTVLA